MQSGWRAGEVDKEEIVSRRFVLDFIHFFNRWFFCYNIICLFCSINYIRSLQGLAQRQGLSFSDVDVFGQGMISLFLQFQFMSSHKQVGDDTRCLSYIFSVYIYFCFRRLRAKFQITFYGFRFFHDYILVLAQDKIYVFCRCLITVFPCFNKMRAFRKTSAPCSLSLKLIININVRVSVRVNVNRHIHEVTCHIQSRLCGVAIGDSHSLFHRIEHRFKHSDFIAAACESVGSIRRSSHLLTVDIDHSTFFRCSVHIDKAVSRTEIHIQFYRLAFCHHHLASLCMIQVTFDSICMFLTDEKRFVNGAITDISIVDEDGGILLVDIDGKEVVLRFLRFLFSGINRDILKHHLITLSRFKVHREPELRHSEIRVFYPEEGSGFSSEIDPCLADVLLHLDECSEVTFEI